MGNFLRGVSVVVVAAFALKGIACFVKEVVEEMNELKEKDSKPTPSTDTPSPATDGQPATDEAQS